MNGLPRDGVPTGLATPSRAVTWRSVGLGLALAVLIVLVTPYNDYVVNNTFIVGSYFPPVVALAVFAVVLLVNGPLHRFAPRLALSPGELAVTMAMGLVACSVPSQGLMRQLLPLPVAPFYFAGQDPKYRDLLAGMHLPSWLFAVDSAKTGAGERVVTAFYGRLQPGEALPWGKWVRPAAAWGAFAAAFMTAMVSLACLLRFQWTVNERLAFPIAQLQGMLVAPPKPGRAFNDVFSARAFWAALAFVLVVQSSLVLNQYFPKAVPVVPSRYDLTSILGDQPWAALPVWLKASNVYFTLVGLSYFTTTRVSFSLWGTAVGVALLRWALDPTMARLPEAAMADQALGASFAFLAGVLWVGRSHWAMIARALAGKRRADESATAIGSYRAAAAAFLAGTAGMFAWLVVVGCHAWLAAAIVLMILMAHTLTARVVAETGLAFLRVAVPIDSILKALPASLVTPRDAFLYGAAHYGFMQSARESTLVFAMHGMNVVDAATGADTAANTAAATAATAADAAAGPPRRMPGTGPVLAGTLVVAAVACAAASLWCYYGYATPMADDAGAGLLNVFGLSTWPKAYLVDFPQSVERGFYAARSYDVWAQLAIGIGVMVFLQAMSWRFAAWPLLPVGYLLCSNWFVTGVWFSLFLGWLAKTLILRFGGARLFNDLKPLFIGLIFGEALGIGLWLIVTLVLALSGEPFHVVRFLPS